MFKLITMSLLFLEISTSLVCKILKSIWLSYESGNQSVTTYPSLFVFKVLQCSASLINNYSAESHVLLSWRQWHPTAVLLPGKSMGSLGVRHDWATSLSLFTFMYWRRKWQPTPVFLPGESHGRGSLVGCRLWGRTESDTAEAT